jgi:ABC-type nitrate/sulfonate/bicarbonate transport system substrate-binding protein
MTAAREVHLGFKAFDIHELACHFVALHSGIYADAGLEVRLLDTTFIPDERLPAITFQSACGAALISWLQGAPLRVIFVAAERPMFWLYGQPNVISLEALRGRHVAGFPAAAPPARFLELILRTAGIDPVHDLTIAPVRDDTARLGLLRAGDAAAAVVSSAVLPHQAERMGGKEICFFGDLLAIPTSGLAVNRELVESEPGLIDAMVKCYRSSLRIIHTQPKVLRDALERYMGVGETDLDTACELIGSCYTANGQCEGHYLNSAVDLMQKAIGNVGELPTEPLYTFR